LRGLALVAFLLAVIGLYGVLAYLVAKRTHEFGVRMALGASQRDVITMLLPEAMRVVGLGVIIGLAASAAAAQVIKGSLYGVGALEASVFAPVAAVVVGVGALAAFVPAWRGSRVDPMIALRSD
jgi:ABC-type antimicrobial peptide transport system permease subunit